jgi:hypothetical protein
VHAEGLIEGQPRSMRRSLFGLAIAAAGLLAATPASSPAADTISAPERCSPRIGCYFSAPRYSMYPGESPIVAMPAVLDFPHDVTSTDKGLDERTLFESPQVGAGKSAVVEGAEYLGPGTYHFICSIHSFPTIYGTRMEADLVVLDNGASPKPRPTIEMGFPKQRLGQVVRKKALAVAARAERVTGQVKFLAKVGKEILASKGAVTLKPGDFQSVELRLGRRALKKLDKRRSTLVTLVGASRFGEPAILRQRLR